jgi:glycosylphosphatidylinositol deacylase
MAYKATWALFIFVVFLSLYFTYHGLRNIFVDLEPNRCAMTYMWPSYVPLANMRTFSRFGYKYNLFLYREGHYDEKDVNVSGVPVLFIPGNAGSYKQVRSIGSVSAWIYSKRPLAEYYDTDVTNVKLKSLSSKPKLNEFDFFAVDFREELSALSGDLLFQQTEYVNDCIKFILSLYKQSSQNSKPTSVIILGHSMGGVIARAAFTAPNYVNNSIRTIITINSPHRIDPILVHPSLTKFYNIVNEFWREQIQNTSEGILRDVAILSIAGGNRDIQISSDLSYLDGLVAPSHGLSVISTQIPKVWLSTDHLSSVWCNQLVLTLSEVLFNLIDPVTRQDTLPLTHRMDCFRNKFQSRFGDVLEMKNSLPLPLSPFPLNENETTSQNFTTIRQTPFVYFLNVSKFFDYKWKLKDEKWRINSYQFTLFTNLKENEFKVFLCDVNFRCVDVTNHKVVPILYSVVSSTHRNFDTKITSVNLFYLSPHFLKDFDYLLLRSAKSLLEDDIDRDENKFLFAQFSLRNLSSVQFHPNFHREHHIELTTNHSLLFDVAISQLSKFSAIRVTAQLKNCSHGNGGERFQPLFVQYVMETGEERHFEREIIVKFNVCPQSRQHRQQQEQQCTSSELIQCYSDVRLFILTDPQCSYDIEFRVDWSHSLGQIFRSYITLSIGCCFSVVLFTLYAQFKIYTNTSHFPPFFDTLLGLLSSRGFLFILIVTLLDILFGPIVVPRLLQLLSLLFPFGLRHAFVDFPSPIPNLSTLLLLHFLAITVMTVSYFVGVFLFIFFGFVAEILLRIGLCKYRTRQFHVRSFLLFPTIFYFGLMTIALATLHHSFALILAVVLLLITSHLYPRDKNIENYVKSMFVFYTLAVLITVPELIIWVKALKIEWQIFSSMNFGALLYIVHLHILPITQPPLNKFCSWLFFISALVIEFYCLVPFYRVWDVFLGLVSALLVASVKSRAGVKATTETNHFNHK